MSDLTRYTYGTEFLDDGKTIELISIGIVCLDDARQYYAVNRGADWTRIMKTPWLVKNVVPHLPTLSDDQWFQLFLDGAGPLDISDPHVKWKSDIAREVCDFFYADGRGEDRKRRELWAYDHVALAQLWGPMMDLPRGIPMFTRDIKDWAIRLDDPKLPKQEDEEHSAIADAWHNVRKMTFLTELEQQRTVRISNR